MSIASKILVFIAVCVIGYFSLISYISSQMTDSSNSTWEAMDSAKLECPEGLETKRERWSKTGYSRSCVKPLHGKWEAWDEGYKHIDGFYNQGKRDGVWVIYRKDGSISKKVTYKDNNEVEIEEMSQ